MKWQVRTLKGKVLHDNLSLEQAEEKRKKIRKGGNLCYVARKSNSL